MSDKVKVTRVGLFRYGFIGGMVSALIALVLFGTNLVLAIVIAGGLAWVVFEQWVVFQAVMGVQRLLIFAMQPKKGDADKQPDVIPIDINTGIAKKTKVTK